MTVSSLKKGLVLQAIEVLRELNKQHSENTNKKSLFEEENTLYLQIMLKKIPKNKLITTFKVNLPHSLVKDTDEICLITGDLDKNNRKAEIEPDVLHYKALLDKHGVTQISKILTLRQLRTEYKTFEAKQKLLAAYDVFLADNKIYECLPRILGKFFFKKRKFPIQMNLKTSNLKQQIESALSAKVFYLSGHGNCCSSEVAYSDMPDSKILDNVMNMVGEISQKVPGNWNNILAIYLKTAKSKSIPIYVSYDPHLDPAVVAVHQMAPPSPSNPVDQPTPINHIPAMPSTVSHTTAPALSAVQLSSQQEFDPSHPIPTQTFPNESFAVTQNMIMPQGYVPATMHHGPMPPHAIAPISSREEMKPKNDETEEEKPLEENDHGAENESNTNHNNKRNCENGNKKKRQQRKKQKL